VVTQTPGLNWVIFRPATVYGPGDVSGITPRLIIGAVYQELKEEMKLLWSGDLRINTVHVGDVVRAIWTVVEKNVKGEIFNLADKGDTGIKSITIEKQRKDTHI
jgi:nucleoside-diphosphate-sugar epimerase